MGNGRVRGSLPNVPLLQLPLSRRNGTERLPRKEIVVCLSVEKGSGRRSIDRVWELEDSGSREDDL